MLNSNDENYILNKLDNINTNEDRPEIHLLDKNADDNSAKQNYGTINPEKFKYSVFKDDFKDYVIIKAKRKLFDVSPYVMMRQLDDIKYMVLWLNLYCEMHPDCNKKTLNEELQKVRKDNILFLNSD